MNAASLLPFVEKYPNVSPEERVLLLDFARQTPLQYGTWKPFKLLFKKTEAALKSGQIDTEMLAVLLRRVDEMASARSSFLWKAVDATSNSGGTSSNNKSKSASGGGFKYTVGPRNIWSDYSGWRLVIEPENLGIVAGLRRALGFVERADAKHIAYEFESGNYIYELKDVKLSGGELTIRYGSSWNKEQKSEFVVDVSDPNFIHLRESGPKTPTIQYMKRRARRILRELSQKNSEVYAQLAVQLLHEHGDKALNARTDWAAFDVLFAQSPRWTQTQPGRGAYVKQNAFVRLRREERAPQIWDARPEVLHILFADKNVPIEANEMALKALRANNAEHRVLDVAQLTRFLQSASPLLQVFAIRQLAQSATLDGATWAQLMLRADAKTRRQIAEKFADEALWKLAATQIFGAALDENAPTKKRRAATVLVERFADEIGDELLWKHLETFADVSEIGRRLVMEKIAQSSANGEFARLSQIARLRQDLRDEAIRVFGAASKNVEPTVEQSLPLVATADQTNNAVGWQFLAATAMTQEVARQLWYRVWDTKSGFANQVHQTAAQNDGALQIFERADFSAEKLEKRLPQVLAFQTALSANFFASIFARVSPRMQIDLALSADDEQWQSARSILLQTLQNPDNLGAFWNRVLDVVASGADADGESATLQARILDDAPIADTFTQMPTSAVEMLFASPEPTVAPYLVRWLQSNATQLARGNATLLAAATHTTSDVRDLGLARVREVGMDLPFALRLMESGLPQPFAMARAWFEMNEKLDLADRALALCDSPDAAVRAFGRTFLEAHRDRVLDEKLLKKLSENSDPQMQAWLAEHLLKDAPNVEVAAFDASVLRARGRARRAKEAVKTRRDLSKIAAATSATPNIEYSNDEVATLLDVARGRTKRDREWALQQLAQIALSGREIDGVALVTNEP